MTLSQFIGQHTDTILEDWVAFARGLPSAQGFDLDVLRDHAAGILRTIATDLEQAQDALAQEENRKAGGRPAPPPPTRNAMAPAACSTALASMTP